ncbi:fibronectin type III domain-containing protein [Sinomicrobium oceani]|uniref:hypothetical protein n=1 Tax=Sinomicrobium oceani TaxID=1150368 RepID=UPI00227C8A4C|nr:hypothetical protein [Sinomicrobium oceani]
MKKSISGLGFIMLLILAACSSDDDNTPQAPGTASLVFPENNSECTAGISVDDHNSSIPFEWEAAERTDSYRLRVENLNDGTAQEFNTEATSLQVVLQKGEPYSWSVTSVSMEAMETTESESWKFYSAGDGIASYAPFPATAISPEPGENITAEGSKISLQWEGNDIDGDITGYDVYFGNSNPPETAIATDITESQLTDIDVNSKTVYYWRIVTKDAQNNSSKSEVFTFKVD